MLVKGATGLLHYISTIGAHPDAFHVKKIMKTEWIIVRHKKTWKYIFTKELHYQYLSTIVRESPSPVAIPLVYNSSWRGDVMEALSTLQALCEGKSPVTDTFPNKEPAMRSFTHQTHASIFYYNIRHILIHPGVFVPMPLHVQWNVGVVSI